MNPNTEPVPAPPQPHRSSFSCDRHPTEQFNGFCPLCLCERLTTLELSTEAAASSSSSRRPSTAAAALKAIFRPPFETKSKSHQNQNQNQNHQNQIFPPELLRRTQSFSASKNEGFSGVLEPQRHSCDVRGRSTLWSLFEAENVYVQQRKSSASLRDEQHHLLEEYGEEIRVCEDEPVIVPNFAPEERIELVEEQVEVKTIKDHIDMDSQPKKPSLSSAMDFKEIAGNFWSAASVLSKRWQKWRHNQKMKKRRHGGGPTLPVEKPISRQFRETQSEIADYGFGRRSCDTDPARFSLDAARMSLDAARISFDDVRPSFDQPRASWDGHLAAVAGGSRSFPRLPPILAAVEDSPAIAHVARSDMQIPVEEEDGETFSVPGGTAQTREYYSESCRRRKSLDRSSSIRKTAAAVVAEMDERRVSVDSNPNLARDDCSETFELAFKGVIGSGERKNLKKSRRWKNIWGLIIRRNGGTKDEDEDEREYRGNGVERSLSSSWQELRGGFNKSVFRTNSNGGSFGSVNGRVLERNRSVRYSPNQVDNGLLRFYLTPLNGSCRRAGGGGGGGMGKSRQNNSHSIARSVLRLY